VVEWAHNIWHPAALTSKKFAVCTRRFPAGSPFYWDVNYVIPEL
jgi:hypothetical protein